MQQSKLGYPYSYGDELTPEIAESNRNVNHFFMDLVNS